jgi:hypothetical protein
MDVNLRYPHMADILKLGVWRLVSLLRSLIYFGACAV